MGVHYKYDSSVVLCPEAEDSNSIRLGEEEQHFHGEHKRRNLYQSPSERCDFYGGMLRDFALPSEKSIALLIEKESHQHLPRRDYAEKLLGGQLGNAGLSQFGLVFGRWSTRNTRAKFRNGWLLNKELLLAVTGHYSTWRIRLAECCTKSHNLQSWT